MSAEPAARHNVLVEVAVDSLAGAEAAASAGADRIELCHDLGAGGLTPSRGLFDAVRAAVHVPVFVMIRPRPGDFLFDAGEIAVMQRDVVHLRAAGAAGIVTGALRRDGAVESGVVRDLIAAAAPLAVTFHRAFDVCADAAAAIDALIALGAARVLTSGQAANALAGADVIRACVQRAGSRLAVIAGGGVRDGNVRDVVARTGVREVHLSAAGTRASAMAFRRGGVPIAGDASPGDHVQRFTDGAIVARVVAALRGA
jgi:copper homeostasis protein